MKSAGKERTGVGQRSTNECASAAAAFVGFDNLRSPNQAPLPTLVSVTPAAYAPVAPDTSAAEL